MSAGEGPLSRIYKTTNGGGAWTLSYTNLDPQGFFDCMAFWDETHGIVLGDPVNGRFSIFTTQDGLRWEKRQGPKANEGEAAFAASGTCIFTRGTREAWFGTGGSRVFHTLDGGESWSITPTPVRHDSASAGIFSVAFSDAMHGIAIGGDYMKPDDAAGAAARTEDGGKTWTAAPPPAGFRSAISYVPWLKLWVATGTSGTDVLNGAWRGVGSGYNAMSFARSTGWAVGPNGSIGRWQ
jgi:photosystem II stability/assembly factor-like uncharacterized protein